MLLEELNALMKDYFMIVNMGNSKIHIQDGKDLQIIL